jgi:hypothetical protein
MVEIQVRSLLMTYHNTLGTVYVLWYYFWFVAGLAKVCKSLRKYEKCEKNQCFAAFL